jgi:hypothetical protein
MTQLNSTTRHVLGERRRVGQHGAGVRDNVLRSFLGDA